MRKKENNLAEKEQIKKNKNSFARLAAPSFQM
jgi:hypothetical protein